MPYSTCPRCGEEFAYRAGKPATCPDCGVVARKSQSTRPRVVDDVEDTQPVRRRKKAVAKESSEIPVAVWVGGVCAAGAFLAAGIIVVVLATRPAKPTEPVETAELNPPVRTPPTPRPQPTPPTTPTPPVVPPKATPDPRPTPNPTPTPNPNPNPTPTPPVDNPNDPAIDREWPTLTPRKRSRETALTPNKTTVRVFAPQAGGKPLVVLDLPTEPYMKPGPFRGLLLRELVRQSLLVAAREELGAQTRDAVLRETTGELAAASPACTLELGWVAPRGKPVSISLTAGTGETTRTLWSADIPVPAGEIFDYERFAAEMEPHIRGGLADALAKEAKVTRVTVKAGQATVPVSVTDRLRAMNWYDQFAAIRELHTLLATTADPIVSGHLAVAYANLGVLTERNWTVAHKAYKARALLYAHRAATDKSAAAKWTLAYTTSLLGLHAKSLERIAEAKKAGAGPDWAPVIEAACRFDHTKLATPPVPEVAELAGLLAFAAAESPDTKAHALEIGFPVLEANPDCFRVVDGVLALAHMQGKRMVTDRAPLQLTATLASKMAKLPGAPVVPADQLRDGGAPAEREFLRLFDAAGAPAIDRGEPSWGALTAAVRDVRFVVLGRRIVLFERIYGIPPNNEVQAAAGYLEDHPDRGYYDQYLAKPNDIRAVVDSYTMSFDRPSLQIEDMKSTLINDRTLYGLDAGRATAVEHLDDCATDLRFSWALPPEDARISLAKRERAVSPYAPTGFARLVASDWAAVAAEPNLEQKWAGQPTALIAIARKRLEDKKPADAERLLRAAAKVSPDLQTYWAIADLNKADDAKYVAVYDEFLTKPDYGLDHARVSSLVAYHFMERKQPKKAWPYAERAALNKSEWGLRTAEVCATQLGDTRSAAAYAEERRRMYGNRQPVPGN